MALSNAERQRLARECYKCSWRLKSGSFWLFLWAFYTTSWSVHLERVVLVGQHAVKGTPLKPEPSTHCGGGPAGMVW